MVECALVGGVDARDGLGDFSIHVGDGFQHALAEILALVAVAQLQGFVFAGGSAGGNRGAAQDVAVENDVRLNGGIAARIETCRAWTFVIFVDISVVSPGSIRINDCTRNLPAFPNGSRALNPLACSAQRDLDLFRWLLRRAVYPRKFGSPGRPKTIRVSSQSFPTAHNIGKMPVTVCQVFGKTSQSGDKRVSRSYHFYVPQRSERGWGEGCLPDPA